MKLVMALALVLTVSSCGTIGGVGRGVGYGFGEVMTGIGDDFTSMGDLFQR